MCDDITTIFVDGEQRNAAGSGVWNQVAALTVPASTNVIGIKCKNIGSEYDLRPTIFSFV